MGLAKRSLVTEDHGKLNIPGPTDYDSHLNKDKQVLANHPSTVFNTSIKQKIDLNRNPGPGAYFLDRFGKKNLEEPATERVHYYNSVESQKQPQSQRVSHRLVRTPPKTQKGPVNKLTKAKAILELINLADDDLCHKISSMIKAHKLPNQKKHTKDPSPNLQYKFQENFSKGRKDVYKSGNLSSSRKDGDTSRTPEKYFFPNDHKFPPKSKGVIIFRSRDCSHTSNPRENIPGPGDY